MASEPETSTKLDIKPAIQEEQNTDLGLRSDQYVVSIDPQLECRCFVGRAAELAQIRLAFGRAEQPARFLIHGMLGIGKSQLAREYMKQSSSVQAYSHMFWVRGDTAAAFYADFAAIAGQVVPAAPVDLDARGEAAKAWLDNGTGPGRWLLVFDNVTKDTLALAWGRLPNKKAGDVLITCRPEIAEHFANLGVSRDITLSLGPLTNEEAEELLLWQPVRTSWNKGRKVTEKEREMIKLLDMHPYALELATAYARSGKPLITETPPLLNEEANELLIWQNLSSNYAKSITTAFDPLMCLIKKFDTVPAKLIWLLAFLEADWLPLGVFSRNSKHFMKEICENGPRVRLRDKLTRVPNTACEWLSALKARVNRQGKTSHPAEMEKTESQNLPTAWKAILKAIENIDTLEEAAQELARYGLVEIRRHLKETQVKIHAVVRLLIRATITSIFDFSVGNIVADKCLCYEIRSLDDKPVRELQEVWELYLPHLESLTVDVYHRCGYTHQTLIGIRRDAALHHLAKGRYSEVERMVLRTLAWADPEIAPKQPIYLIQQWVLYTVYCKQERMSDVALLKEKILDLADTPWNGESPSDIADVPAFELVIHDIEAHEALFNHSWLEAERKLLIVLGYAVRHWGKDSNFAISVLMHLVIALAEQERFHEAQNFTEMLIDKCTSKYGCEDDWTVDALGLRAWLLSRRGLLERAEKAYSSVLDADLKFRGRLHPMTLKHSGERADVLRRMKQFTEAEKILVTLTANMTTVLGRNHRRTLNALWNLGLCRAYAGQTLTATVLLEEVLTDSVTALGSEYPETVAKRKSLARIREGEWPWD